MTTVTEKVDRLEEALMRLVYIQQKTEIEMQSFKQEMKEFKDEMKEFKDWSQRNIDNLNQQWGNLANKLGTLVEDIFAPSIDRAIQKYFDIVPNMIDVKKLIRKDGNSLEIDILALHDAGKQAYVVEVKSSPDRTEYIERFLEKLEAIPHFLPNLAGYTITGIYAGLNMNKETVTVLTGKQLYAMVFRGDFLEIVNFDALKD